MRCKQVFALKGHHKPAAHQDCCAPLRLDVFSRAQSEDLAARLFEATPLRGELVGHIAK
jgi:hypothetical protein